MNDRQAIEATGLTKTFGATRAVDGVDLRVPEASVFGFLGPNGAGKTTTIRMLATLLQPDAGTARVLGHDIVTEAGSVRARIGLTGQFASVDEDLTGRENLTLLSRLLGCSRPAARKRAADVLEGFGLADAADRVVRTYSGGMRRRLDIAASVLVPPDLLFLDEPTTGLDPSSRAQVWELVRALAGQGTTVVLTTQYLDEANRLADRIAVIDHGRIVADGSGDELRSSVGTSTLRLRLSDPGQRPEAERVLSQALGGVDVHERRDPAALSAGVPDADEAARALASLVSAGVGVSEFAVARPSLDEVFLALTGTGS